MISKKTTHQNVRQFELGDLTASVDECMVEPAFATQVGFFLTFRCPIRCRHCMVNAGPDRTEEVELAEVLSWLQQVATYDNGIVQSIGFTGGEPFFCWDKLMAMAEAARRLGLTYTVITSGYWAGSRAKTKDLLAQLQPGDLSVSTDLYHTEYISLENVKRIYEACQELDIRCDIILAYDPRTWTKTRTLVQQILTFAPATAIRLTRVFPAGRGMSQADFCDGSACNQPASTIPCLFATVPYIFPNGEVMACIGPVIVLPRRHNPLYLGSLRQQSLADIFDKSQANPILHGLRLWGPHFWHRLIEQCGPAAALPSGYYTNCPCEGCVAMLQNPEIAEFLYRAADSPALKTYVAQMRSRVLGEEITAGVTRWVAIESLSTG